MKITAQEFADATAAVNALSAALSAREAVHGPIAEEAYDHDTLLPLLTNATIQLAATLGGTLLEERIAAAKMAVAPFCTGEGEITRVAEDFTGPRKMRAWFYGLQESRIPSNARRLVKLLLSIFETVLAAASAE